MHTVPNRLTLAVIALLAATPLALAEQQPGYRIVSEDAKADGVSLAIRLDGRVSETDLKALSEALHAKRAADKQPRVLTFYLPAMTLNSQPWAEVRFEPDTKVSILGLRLEEEVAFGKDAAADGRPLIGAWLTSPPALPGRLLIWRDKAGKTFAEWSLRNGQKTLDEVTEVRSQRGRRFEIAGSDGGYYLALWSGGLELGEKSQVIAVAEKLTIPVLKAASPAPIVQAPPTANGTVQASQAATDTTIANTPPEKKTAPKSKVASSKPASPKTAANNVNDAISGVYGN